MIRKTIPEFYGLPALFFKFPCPLGTLLFRSLLRHHVGGALNGFQEMKHWHINAADITKAAAKPDVSKS